ncbi:MAG: hypothetical protein LBL80_01085 [Ruminococcus sp.]|jgi:hypothetical protein|nr:hypothetical protein [Ruminococcus sp.]
MKKEVLIKKAASYGITLDETQAEKYSTLSDEELANLDISGGCKKDNSSEDDKNVRRAVGCSLFTAEPGTSWRHCGNCSNMYAVGCTHPDAM